MIFHSDRALCAVTNFIARALGVSRSGEVFYQRTYADDQMLLLLEFRCQSHYTNAVNNACTYFISDAGLQQYPLVDFLNIFENKTNNNGRNSIDFRRAYVEYDCRLAGITRRWRDPAKFTTRKNGENFTQTKYVPRTGTTAPEVPPD